MRRLPIFILVDTSGKMAGDRIVLVNNKINELISNLRQDPYALETAYIFIASYNMEMRVCLPLTELASGFDLLVFEAKSSTPSMLGSALFSLESIFEKTIKKSTAGKKGDYPPELYILTGGKPSDSSAAHDAMEQLLNRWNMQLRVGLTSSTLVFSYESLFSFRVSNGGIIITDLSSTDGNYGVDKYRFIGLTFEATESLDTSIEISPPPKEIHISF
jgi:hypothetical protein